LDPTHKSYSTGTQEAILENGLWTNQAEKSKTFL